MVKLQQRQTGATSEQLRADIDSGRTHDKVAHPDPAVAPLGTDEEAAGTRIDPIVVSVDRQRERLPERTHKPVGQTTRSRLLIIVLFVMISAALIVFYRLLAAQL
jgi:hypothetical protein